MIKFNKSNKSFLALLLIAMFMINNLNAFFVWKKMKTCRHVKTCFLAANALYRYLHRYFGLRMKLKLAIFMTYWMRTRMRGPMLSAGFYSTPIIHFPAFRTNPPYPGYRAFRYLEADQRLLEAAGVSSMKEMITLDDEEENLHIDRIAETNNMETAKQLACEGVKIDSEFYKGAYEMVSNFYKMHLKRVHFLETKENRPLDYFNLDCFSDPNNKVENSHLNLSEVESFMTQKVEREYMNTIFEVFDIAGIVMPKGMDEIPEMSNDGSNHDGTAITTVPLKNDLSNSFHVVNGDEEAKILADLS